MSKKKRRPPRRPAPPKLAPRTFLTQDDPAAAEARRRLSAEAWADLREFDERLRRLNDAMLRRHAPAPLAPTPSRPRGGRKLTDEVWSEHLRRHPLAKNLGAPTRVNLLKADQGIVVRPSTVTRRLQKEKRKIPS